MKILLGICAVIALIVCVAVAFLHLQGSLTMPEYKRLLLMASVVYFVLAVLWATRAPEKPARN